MTFYVGLSPFGAVGIVDNSTYVYNFLGLMVRETTGAFVPPPNPGNTGNGKKGGSPGQQKKAQAYLAKIEHVRHRRKRHEFENDATAFIPAQYLSPGSGSQVRGIDAIDWRQSVRRISISPSGHTVRN